MKIIRAKYTGQCCDCIAKVSKGDVIGVVSKGKVTCNRCAVARLEGAHEEDLEEGDHDERDWPPPPSVLASDRRLARRGLTVVRFSSGAVMTQNSRGRCEDAPCCGCCS